MSRKVLTLVAAMLLIVMVVTACNAGGSTAAGDVKLGLGTVNRIDKSKDAGEADGLAQTDAVIAAVTIDSEGKIVAVSIDVVQSRVAFTADGELATDPTTMIQTKKELGDDYNMKRVSSLNKEWYEQIEELEKWMVGKTVADLDAMKLTDGRPDDLKTTVTIIVSDYLAAVKKAIANAG